MNRHGRKDYFSPGNRKALMFLSTIVVFWVSSFTGRLQRYNVKLGLVKNTSGQLVAILHVIKRKNRAVTHPADFGDLVASQP